MPPEIVELRLKEAERHVAIGETCIARQRRVIARFERHDGCEDRLLRAAVRLLTQFLEIQALHLADRDRLMSELGRAATDRRIAQGQFRMAQQREMISRMEGRGEDTQSAKDQLAGLEGRQAALLAHRDRLDGIYGHDAEDIAGPAQEALLSLLKVSIADASAQLNA